MMYKGLVTKWKRMSIAVIGAGIVVGVSGCAPKAGNTNENASQFTGPEGAVRSEIGRGVPGVPLSISGNAKILDQDTVSLSDGMFMVVDFYLADRYEAYYTWKQDGIWRAIGIGVSSQPSDGTGMFTSVSNSEYSFGVAYYWDHPDTDHVVAFGSQSYTLARMGTLPIWVGRFPKGFQPSHVTGYSSSNQLLWNEPM